MSRFRNPLVNRRCHKSGKMKHLLIWLLALTSISSGMFLNPKKRLSTIIATSSTSPATTPLPATSTTTSATFPIITVSTYSPTVSLTTKRKLKKKKTTPPTSGGLITENEYLLEKLCNQQSLDIRIRNGNTKEFLYAAPNLYALDDQKRRIFTWKDVNQIPGAVDNVWNGEETWRIEPVNKYYFSNSFRVKNTRNVYGPREYLFANSPDTVYVRRDLPDETSVEFTLGSSAKWRMLAKVAGELRGDICSLQISEIQGFVLGNEKYTSGYLSAEEDDIFIPHDAVDDKRRRNTRLSVESPSYWDILPSATYRPTYISPVAPGKRQDGIKDVKLDMNCNFYRQC